MKELTKQQTKVDDSLQKEKLAQIDKLKTFTFSSDIKVLKEELDLLGENYSVDAGGDFIIEEEFEDISYHQKDFKPTHFIWFHFLPSCNVK